jgi:very-short-patch-repair endonuclease
MSSIVTFDAGVARLADRQRSLITHRQAVGLGATPSMVRTRVVTGRWIQVARGLYRVNGAPVTWHQRAVGACLLAGPGAVASHRSAAVIWGLSGFRPGRLEITVPPGRSARNALAAVHRSRHLPARDRTTNDRIPVTRPVRTVLDLAGRLTPELMEEAVDDALCRRLATVDALLRRVDECGRRHGAAVLRTILQAWNTDGTAANVAEMRIVRLILDAGFTGFVPQHEIHLGGQFVARVDLGHQTAQVAIELDSFRWHAGRGPFRSDRVRGNRIAAAGWTVLRATPEDAADGRELLRALGGLLAVAA